MLINTRSKDVKGLFNCFDQFDFSAKIYGTNNIINQAQHNCFQWEE